MNSTSLRFAAMLAFIVIGVTGWYYKAEAATPGAGMPAAAYGAVAVNVTATAVPTSPMGGRNAVSVVNLGPAIIYCGWTSAVTTLTGYPVAANGGVLSVDVTVTTYNGVMTPKLWCITTALQVSPANTRYMEVR